MEIANCWMGYLYKKYPAFKDISINKLLIPGSHDSGTSKMSSSAKTQSLTIKEQLEQGIRYLDIRPKVHNSTYYVHHTETGPDGSADLGHYSANLDPDSASDNYIFKQIRDFLIRNPQEILILKFQNYKAFNRQDYFDFIALINAYFTIDTPEASKCELARFVHGTGTYIAHETVGSLIDSHKRVFIVWDTENVPTDPQCTEIWDLAFQFTPSLEQEKPYCLWDPYWHDADASLANDESAQDFDRWWDWHDKNLTTWAENAGSGFFVLQSQMQQLPIGDADASAKRNNPKNIQHYISWAEAGKPMNIMTFDFVNYGDLCQNIVDYYEGKFV